MELELEGAPAKKRRLDEPENVDIQIPSTSRKDQAVKKSGLSHNQHGVAYQIKLLMLFFHRGAKQGYSFKLETELTDSGKLDDVVFRYDKRNDKIEDGVRYLQAKHSDNIETQTIQFKDLLKETDKLFGLSKYYLTFLEIVEVLKLEGKSTEFIKQITLCTNIKFHTNLVKCMDNTPIVTTDEDDILYGNVVLNRYTFKTKDDAKKVIRKTEFPCKDDIVSNLSTITDMHALANKLAKDLCKPTIKLTFKTSLYQTYHGWLVKHIFELPSVRKPNYTEKWYVTFQKNFIKIKDGKLKAFRDNDVREFRQLIDDFLIKNIKGPNSLTEFIAAGKTIIVSKGFFRKPQSNCTPDNSVSNDLIETFLSKLVFVVTCDEKSLGEAIELELGNDFSLIEAELIESKLQKQIIAFMRDKDTYFLTQDTWKQFINEVINTIARYASMGITSKWKTKTKQYNCEFKTQEKEKRTLDKIMTAESDKQLMIIYQKYPLLTEIKILQVIAGCEKRDEYIVNDLEDSINNNELNLNILDDDTEPNRGLILKAFSSKKRSHLIIINVDVKICDKGIQFFKDAIDVIKKNRAKQFTLITAEKDIEISNIFQNAVENFEEFDDDDTFLDLTAATQNLLKKRNVLFQGSDTDLGMLITDDKLKKYVKGEILFKLIDSEKIVIGDAPAHQSNLDTFEETKNFYIERSLFRLIKINNNIRGDKDQFCITTDGKIDSNRKKTIKKKKKDIVLITQNVVENVFQKLCETSNKINTNIHWLVDHIHIGLVWQTTRGDQSRLHQYVDRHFKMRDSEVDGRLKDEYTFEMNIVTSSSENMIIVAADPGMGKSTLLTHLSSTLNETNKDTWVVRINLIDYQTQFDSISKDNIDERNAIKFLYKVLKFEKHDKTGKEINIFDYATLEGNLICLDIDESLGMSEVKVLEIAIFNKLFNENNVVLILDGFDEINQTYSNLTRPIISWVAQIKNMAKMKKIWMTTRSYDSYDIQFQLENKLSVFSYQLNPITEMSKKFVKRFWKSRLTQTQSESLEINIKKTDDRFDVYIEELFKIYFSKQSDSTFIGVPLHIRMIAEIYEKGFQEFFYSEDSEYLKDQLKYKIKNYSLISLYEEFVNTKFYILHKDIDRNLFKNTRMLRTELKEVISYHQKLSLIEILNEDAENLISERDIDEIGTKFKENNIGLVSGVGNKLRLVHRTFAEYFTAGYLVYRLKRDNAQNKDTNKVLSCINACIKLDVMKFVNYYLIEEIDNDNRALLNGVLNGDLKVLENKDLEGIHDSFGRTPLHLACISNLNNFKYVFDMHPAALNSKDTLFGWTPLHYAIACHTKCDLLNDSLIIFLIDAMKRPDVQYDVNQKDKFDETLLMLSIKNVVFEDFFALFISFDEMDLDYENKHHMTVVDHYYNCYSNCEFFDYKEDYVLKKADLRKGTIGKRLLNILDYRCYHTQITYLQKIIDFRGEEYTKKWIEVCIESDNNFIVKLLSENLIVAKLVLYIESRHIDVNFKDTDKNTALKRAVVAEKEKATCVHYQEKKPRRDIVFLLLKAGAFYDDIEPNDLKNFWSKPDYFLETINNLNDSIEKNDANSTESILSKLDYKNNDKDVLVNLRDRKKCMTPLQFAASLGYKDIVICLLKHGAFYNMWDETRNVKTAETLTQNRDICNVLAKTRYLFSAVKEGNIKNVDEYLNGDEYGIVNFKDRKGKQPIHLALENKNLEIIKLLLNTNGIEPARATTLDQTNILHLAVKSENKEIIQTFTDYMNQNRHREHHIEEVNYLLSTADMYQSIPLHFWNMVQKDDEVKIEIRK